MDTRRRVYMWSGSALAVAGLGVALVAWVGLDRANQYLGVPSALAGILGLALSAYGAFMQRSDPGVTQVIERAEVGGKVQMIGQASRQGSPNSGAPAASEPGSSGQLSVSQTIRDAKITGNVEMTGRDDTGPESRENA